MAKAEPEAYEVTITITGLLYRDGEENIEERSQRMLESAVDGLLGSHPGMDLTTTVELKRLHRSVEVR
jgi:cobalamin biosynthesis protein CbiD